MGDGKGHPQMPGLSCDCCTIGEWSSCAEVGNRLVMETRMGRRERCCWQMEGHLEYNVKSV